MRRMMTVLLSVVLLVGAFALPQAEAGKPKKKTRKASGAYELPALGVAGLGLCSPGTIGCVPFPLAAGEKFVSLTINDSTGAPVFASITQDVDGDNTADESVDICGKTDKPVAVKPGVEVLVFIWEGPGRAESGVCAGASSSGTIDAVFSNLP